MELLINEDAKRAVTSLFDARVPLLPTFQAGDALAVSVGLADEVRFPFSDRLFTPRSLSGITFRAAIGDADSGEAATIATLSAASAAVSIAVNQVQLGQDEPPLNHQVRVTFSGDIYGGSWLYAMEGGQSEPIGWGDTDAQIRAKLEAINGGFATGAVSIQQEDEDNYLITFIGDLAATPIAGIAVDGTNLLGVPKKSGVLDLNQNEVFDLIGEGESSKVVSLEIEKLEGGNAPVKILRRDVLLTRAIIESDMADTPTLNATTAQVLPNITSFTGTGPSDLPSVNTSGLIPGGGVPYFIRLNGAFIAVYFDEGAADPDDPAQVSPMDGAGNHWTRGN